MRTGGPARLGRGGQVDDGSGGQARDAGPQFQEQPYAGTVAAVDDHGLPVGGVMRWLRR
jgi:hypothetical protein